MTAEVCNGLRRPKLVQGRSKLRSGKASCQAMTTPTRNPTTPPEHGGERRELDRAIHVALLLGRAAMVAGSP